MTYKDNSFSCFGNLQLCSNFLTHIIVTDQNRRLPPARLPPAHLPLCSATSRWNQKQMPREQTVINFYAMVLCTL